MNSWGQENYQMAMPPMMPPPMLPTAMMMQEMNMPPINPPAIPIAAPFENDEMNIVTEEMTDTNNANQDVSSNQIQKPHSKSRERSQRRDKDRQDRRHRSRSRDHHDRYGRSDRRNTDRNDRIRDNERDRKTKWDNEKGAMNVGHNSIQQLPPAVMNMGMMPGMNMISFPNMLPNMMGQQPMDGVMHQQMMPNMMMSNMIPNMMDQNIIMVNQQNLIPLPNQPIYLTSGVMLPPIPGTATPQRRERPKGCHTIFVGGLPVNVTEETLMEMFQRFGGVDEIKSPKSGVYYIRFARAESVETSFLLTGYRFKFHDQHENEATTVFVDYALNREDQNEYERKQRHREKTPPRVEPFSHTALTNLSEKIKSETEFATAGPTLAVWLERGECSKKHANAFYSLIQASNNQIRRLFAEKMHLDEEFQNMKNVVKDKFAHVVMQFDQVAKILSAAKHQRVSDHFTKQQRRNIEMWLKMTEEVENIKEEYNALFDEDESEKPAGKNAVPLEKYEQLKQDNENLTYELEGYKNEAYLAKDEAERKFEKFKAHFIAQQALQNKQAYPPLPNSNQFKTELPAKPLPPPDEDKVTSGSLSPSEAKLISILTAFLLVHPLGASVDYLVSYVKSMTRNVNQATITSILQKFPEVFRCERTGVGACIEHKWVYVTFDKIKNAK